MAIRRFEIGPRAGLQRAHAENLPDLVVIAGPNGIGKSTLLSELWRRKSEFAEQDTQVTYLGPHRPWRKTQLGNAALFQLPYSYRQLLEMPNFPGWDQFAPPGLQYLGQVAREASGADEALSLLKFSIAKTEMRRLRLLQAEYDRQGGQIAPGTLVDVFRPLRTLTEFLLPHLSFERVDLSEERNVKCLFRRVDGDTDALVEIDELSSGEKAIIGLFYPFLERQIDSVLAPPSAGADVRPLATTLIDEPEIHLHPTLQASLVEYMRRLASERISQFIITTHSPSLLDALDQDEFYMLAPVSFVADGNQFVRVSSTPERLEAIRDLTGSSHLVTRCRPVIFVEGERPGASSAVTDQRLMESLVPEAAGWVVVPSKGRAQAILSATALRDAAADGLPGVPVFALVDGDQATATDPDHAIPWPVAMIENLLLDADAIWEVLQPQRERVLLASVEEIQQGLLTAAHDIRDDEIRLRLPWLAALLRVDAPVDEPFIPSDWRSRALERAEAQVGALGDDASLSDSVRGAREAVDAIEREGRQLEAFRGKAIFRLFFDRHAKRAGLSYPGFVYAVAVAARTGPRLQTLVSKPVRQIQGYVPSNLLPIVQEVAAGLPEGEARVAAEALARDLGTARAEWEAATTERVDRAELRARVARLAREAEGAGLTEPRMRLLKEMVQIGLGSPRR